MADLAYPTRAVGLSGAVLPAAPPVPFLGARAVGLASELELDRDWRFALPNTGTITDNNVVMVKPSPTAPEVPFVGARVRLHRLSDGYCAWEGVSDATGHYWPRSLEVGMAYYPVAIDPTGTHECDAAGPVTAVEAP